jgi:hypothetical protein
MDSRRAIYAYRIGSNSRHESFIMKKLIYPIVLFSALFSISEILVIALHARAETRTRAPQLYVASKTIWPTRQVAVCWETSGNNTEKDWVRSAVNNTWERESGIDFTGWGNCGSNSRGIRIQISDERPHTAALGRQNDGVRPGMVLNFTFKNWTTSCQSTRERCIRSIAVHEFGHAMGFSHEQNRPDTPSTCTDEKDSWKGDTTVGAWDLSSVMNYCNPNWNNGGQLSATDIEGARRFYPFPKDYLKVTAAWQQGNHDEIQVYDWQYNDYRKKYDELWNQGWRLYILKNRVVNNKVLYTAVWRKGNFGEIQAYEWSYEDYRKKYDELWNQGWRLYILNNVVVNGQVRYTAVWRPDTSSEIQAYEWSYQDYRKKYDELWNEGWRLYILSNVVVNGQVRYTAVWRRGNFGEIQVYEWPYEDYRKKYDELWNQGWRLHILNNVVVNGQVRYTAVWRPDTSSEIQVYDWLYVDFRKKYDELWNQGWRLKLLDVH